MRDGRLGTLSICSKGLYEIQSLWATYQVCSSLSIFIHNKLMLIKLNLKKPADASFHAPTGF